nr:MAG TPA: Protein of unknown function (DUF4054) [Bacteriophage sp.]
MACGITGINDKKLDEALAYFRIIVPEMSALSDDVFKAYATRSLLYIPSYVFKGCDCWAFQKELLCMFVAHWIELFSIMDNVDENGKPLPPDLMRTARSLSEGGLSVSYEDVKPVGAAPHVLYDWLSRTAYGELVKMMLEKCLSGAKGVAIV